MTVIAAVDDNNGMMFNHRRQSQDHVLRERILDMARDSALWMDDYSAKQFRKEDNADGIRVDDDFLSLAGPGDFCFVEDRPLAPYAGDIEKIILIRWNRSYPGDVFFDIDLSGWDLVSTEDFAGSSHEDITMEVYTRG